MKKKTVLVVMLVVIFFPVMLVGAICASVKVAYKYGYITAMGLVRGI